MLEKGFLIFSWGESSKQQTFLLFNQQVNHPLMKGPPTLPIFLISAACLLNWQKHFLCNEKLTASLQHSLTFLMRPSIVEECQLYWAPPLDLSFKIVISYLHLLNELMQIVSFNPGISAYVFSSDLHLYHCGRATHQDSLVNFPNQNIN